MTSPVKRTVSAAAIGVAVLAIALTTATPAHASGGWTGPSIGTESWGEPTAAR